MKITNYSLFLLVLFSITSYAGWKPVEGRLMTEWAKEVNPKMPLPEYPRPQMVREKWINLNGLWDYAITSKQQKSIPKKFDGQILVPFCIESALSGVKKKFTTNDRLWYSRSFVAPKLNGERLILNFGAVDYETTVYINGKEIGYHKGGYDAFSFDITDALTENDNKLIVSVTDDMSGPKGKQSVNAFDDPKFIFYTATSGIWQTVWLESVPVEHISKFKITPDIDKGTVSVIVQGSEGEARIKVLDQGKVVNSVDGFMGEEIVINIADVKLWSPDSPFLYDLEITYGDDVVKSYFGMRKFSKGKDEEGHLRPMLNNKPIFMSGPLDQGYWPDGIYTAPTDEALKFDLEITKKLGFNTTRKHVKVEPARWYYWADKLGLLVWQDMPNGSAGVDARGFRDGVAKSKVLADQFELEMIEMIDEHYNNPSIVVWVIFNEAWGQYDTPRLTDLARKQDSTRLLVSGSGWFLPKDCGDIIDRHAYKKAVPVSPDKNRIGTLGEFGGLGYVVPGHLWIPNQTTSSVYGTCTDQRHYETLYLDLWRDVFKADKQVGMSAAIYTQLTDVEAEVNGLITYDRKIIKSDVELFRKAVQERSLPSKPKVNMLLPTSRGMAQEWFYTTDKPSEDWMLPEIDFTMWKKGKGVFGHKVHRNPAIEIGTEWKKRDLWVARKFELNEKLKRPVLRIAYDDNATVYINGVKAFVLKSGNNTRYIDLPFPANAIEALKVGKNIISIHVDNAKGNFSQYIDAGIGDETLEW